jgi:polyketide synthase PksM
MNWGYWGSVGAVASPEYRKRMAQAGQGSIEPAEAMQALEHLLTGPVDQMALLKTTQPWDFEMMQAEEALTVFPECLPSFIHNLHNHRPPLLKQTDTAVTVSAPKVDTSKLEDTMQAALNRTTAKALKVKEEE